MLQMEVVLIMRIVQHGIIMRFIDSRNRANVTRYGRVHFIVVSTIEFQQLTDLDRLARVTDVQLVARFNRSLVDTKYAQAALEGIDIDHEHVPDGMCARIGAECHFLGILAFAFQEDRRIALRRVRHQALENVQQFRNAGTGSRGYEANGHEVALSKRLFKRLVQLLRFQFIPLLEIDLHQIFVDFDHLVDDSLVCRFDAIKSCLRAVWLKETIDDDAAVCTG